MKIIIINGYAGVGKSTFVEMCKKDYLVTELSTIDPIKDIASKIGWNGQKEPKDRKFLSDLKDLLSRYNDYPFKATINSIYAEVSFMELLKVDAEEIFFVHCREPEEIERFKNELGARSLIIRRHGPETVTQINHADNNVFNMVYDYTIFNEGSLEDLEKSAKEFMEKLKSEDWKSHVERSYYELCN